MSSKQTICVCEKCGAHITITAEQGPVPTEPLSTDEQVEDLLSDALVIAYRMIRDNKRKRHQLQQTHNLTLEAKEET
jgi:hypothetical protein